MAKNKILSVLEQERVRAIMEDPAKWCQVFIKSFNPSTKKVESWVPRWYQNEMFRDKSTRKVYRCGRRIGKTETMVMEMLHKANVNRNFRIIVACPYETQVRNIFTRINEIMKESPLLKKEIVGNTKNPYKIELRNGSMILGFTTGDDASSIRGQKADWIYIDEIDFMSEYCFEVVAAIAIERAEIGITVSSTPTGKRSHFYRMCTMPEMGYSQHYHPSMHNPGWNEDMEAELKAQLTSEGYVHEVLAEFGTEEKGVFPKGKLDESATFENYAYNELTRDQVIEIERAQRRISDIKFLDYSKENKAPFSIFRTMGVDWDKYGASSSLLILDYDIIHSKFKVIKRVEVPRSEYSYDNAINLIIELNDIYNPSFIYCDAGAGEYQIERLHIYGDEHPATGLKNKVKRCQFSESLEIIDPITHEKTKAPLKEFMINQLVLGFERSRIMLSPYDKILMKQLVNYEVVSKKANGQNVYTSKDEHFIDALGLAHLAMVQEFPKLTDTIKKIETSALFKASNKTLNTSAINQMKTNINSLYSNTAKYNSNNNSDDHPSDRQRWYKESTSMSRVGRSGGAGSMRRSAGMPSRSGFGGGRSLF